MADHLFVPFLSLLENKYSAGDLRGRPDGGLEDAHVAPETDWKDHFKIMIFDLLQ